MLRRSTIVSMLALGLTSAASPAAAMGTSEDVASTHMYILANYAFARASEARVGAAQAAVIRLNRRLGRECPDVGAGSPQDEESQAPSFAVAGALWSVSYGANAGPIAKFVKTVKPLRWTNPKLAHIAQSYAKSLHELATLPLPDLCNDVREWRKTGFQTVPAATTRFARYVESIEGHTIPSHLLAPYTQVTDRGILAQTARLETKLLNTETAVGFNDWDMVLATLGLNQ
jgi:hypothetical protein